MNRERLYQVLFEQQETFKEKIEVVPREITPIVLSFLKSKLPIIITGMRRSGKSTLLKIIQDELSLKEKEFLYVNFNDERLISFSHEDFQKILDFLEEHSYKKKCFLFIDEIQEVKKWEKWVDRIKEKHHLLITGSNAKLLSKEISTLLTGRSINVSLYPFSFREVLIARKINITNFQLNLKLQSRIRKETTFYLKNGGIPKYVVDKDIRLLPELYENIIYRDIIKRFNPNLEKPIKEISLYLLSNISKEVSFRSLSKLSGITNLATLKSIIEMFEKAFLLFFIHKFDFSVRKQLQNPRKIYCIDNGFPATVGFRFSEEKGRALENAVFMELQRQGKEVYYFSGKGECDFIIKKGTKIIQAIQVCYQLNESNKTRELSGLQEAMEKHAIKRGLIITLDQEEELDSITILPVWKWLLSD